MWARKPLAVAAGTFRPELLKDSRKKVTMKLNSPLLLISVDNNLVRRPMEDIHVCILIDIKKSTFVTQKE